MKKILLLVLLAFIACELSYGQFALGLRLGYSGNKLTTNIDSIKSDFNNGFHAGIWSRFGKRLYVAPEFLYLMSGTVFTKEGNVSTQDWKQKITIGSIDIPVMVGFKIIHSDFLTWRIELGPEVAIPVNKKVKEMNSVTNGPITTDDIKGAAWFASAGTGIDFLFLRFDIRYQYGLNQLIQDVNNYTFDTKNSMLLVSVGVKLFGKK
jgi:hypothetical protein